MLAGRISVYDNEFYLTSTFPPPLSTTTVSLSPYQRASMAIMHIFIQCPRLNIMVRKATTNPDNTADLVAAVTMAESLWQLDVAAHVLPLLTSSITAHPTPPVEELADIMTESLSFDSVQNSILCTRYWMLQNILCGFVDTLHRWFPTETALSLLPQQDVLYKLDTDAALQLGQSVAWANSISQKLPLVPLRLHTPLQLSIGPWWRLSRHLKGIRANNPALDPDTETSITFQLDRAERMKAWAIVQCNVIHKQWDVSPVAEKPLMEALNTMAGEKIPEWMPVRVRFEAEDGEMVMKLDYENKTGSYQERFDLSEKPPKSVMARTSTYRALADALTDDAELEGETRELPYRIASPWNPETRSAAMIEQYESNRNTSMQIKNAADFVHATGRNLCSTSGWWPTSDTDDSSRILLDMTHKASTFSKIPRPAEGVEELDNGYEDRHPCLASSFWPQTPNNGPMSRVHTPLSTDVSSMWATSASSSAQGSREKRSSLSPAWTTIEDLTPSSNESPSTQQQEDEIHGALNLKDL